MRVAAMSRPYVGHCVKCDELVEISTATALCEKCSPKLPKTKKEGSNGG